MVKISDFDFDYEFDIGFDEKNTSKSQKEHKIRIHTEKGKEKFDFRRYTSEQNLLNAVDWHFEQGTTYHCMSHGDVDSLTFLKHILRQQKLKYLLISTWCIAAEDAEEIKIWVEKGLIQRFDCYLGEIARSSYAQVQQDLQLISESTGGRCGIFRNHAKVMVGYGNLFDFVITSSANVNTNPRTENTAIFCSKEIANFYKDFYDGIKPFNRCLEGWKPYNVK